MQVIDFAAKFTCYIIELQLHVECNSETIAIVELWACNPRNVKFHCNSLFYYFNIQYAQVYVNIGSIQHF